MPFGGIFLTAFYAAAFSLLYLNPVWKRRLDVFAPVGRMALTNYLCQSIISVLVFYGWGLGLSARFQIGPTLFLAYWIVLFTLQIYFSRWWLSPVPVRSLRMALALPHIHETAADEERPEKRAAGRRGSCGSLTRGVGCEPARYGSRIIAVANALNPE